LEALRWIGYLKKDGTLILNDQRIDPMPVITGNAKYPESIVEKIKNSITNVVAIDALEIAKKCGNIKAVNTVLLGLLAKSTAIDKQVWIESLKQNVPSKALEVNLKAFEAGYMDN